jgi:hypothetical protein
MKRAHLADNLQSAQAALGLLAADPNLLTPAQAYPHMSIASRMTFEQAMADIAIARCVRNYTDALNASRLRGRRKVTD